MLRFLSAASVPSAPTGGGTAVGSAAETEAAADFAAFHRETAVPLWRYIYRTCGDTALADDLMQESFLRLLKRPKVLADGAVARPYLYRIASNLLRDRWRRETRRQRLAPTPRSMVAEDAEHARETRIRGDVHWVLERLSARERALVWLAHVDGYHHQEIAQILGLRRGSVKVMLHRAKAKMLGLLEGQGYIPGDAR